MKQYTLNSKSFLSLLQKADDSAFKVVLDLYHNRLLLFATHYLNSKEDAEDIVQDVFIKLWEKKKQINIKTNLNAYLFSMTRNACLDHLRAAKSKVALNNKEQVDAWINHFSLSNANASNLIEKELEQQIEKAIALLPDKSKNVFIKSRIQGIAHHEISTQLNISSKTVEYHIGRALKHMRLHLQEFLHLF